MKYGLSDKQLQEIKEILASYESVEKAVLFGSRAIDTYKEASDVDIAIKGKKADCSKLTSPFATFFILITGKVSCS
jgi:predicted nucleotidyltransferase